MRRRTLLAAVGTAGVPVLSACLDDDPVDAPTASPGTPTPNPPTTGDRTDTSREIDFAVLDRACGNGENAASVTYGDDSVTVEGVIGGRDTCDIAELASANLVDDRFTVTVAVVEEPQTETVACAQCLTDIAYRFIASLPSMDLPSVRVVHRSADGESTVTTTDPP